MSQILFCNRYHFSVAFSECDLFSLWASLEAVRVNRATMANWHDELIQSVGHF